MHIRRYFGTRLCVLYSNACILPVHIKTKKKDAAKWKKGSQNRRKTNQHGRMVLTKQATREEPVADV